MHISKSYCRTLLSMDEGMEKGMAKGMELKETESIKKLMKNLNLTID